jgi:hypothetical protein
MGAKRSGTKLKASKKTSAKAIARKQTAASSGVVPTAKKLAHLVESMGNNWVARMLEVSPSQPSRWRTGEEGISAENARQLTDLEYVMSRLLQLYSPSLAKLWLESYNANLEGRPVDVFHLRGALAVAEAIDAEAQGAYA